MSTTVTTLTFTCNLRKYKFSELAFYFLDQCLGLKRFKRWHFPGPWKRIKKRCDNQAFRVCPLHGWNKISENKYHLLKYTANRIWSWTIWRFIKLDVALAWLNIKFSSMAHLKQLSANFYLTIKKFQKHQGY